LDKAIPERLSQMHDSHARQLRALAAEGRLRRLAPRRGLDFSSNDYLGLATSDRIGRAIEEAIRGRVPIGSGGSRLLRGNHEEHERLESAAAEWAGAESALFFATGFAANAALLATLPQRGDLILADELIHASAHDGLRLARCEARLFDHNDPRAAEVLLANWRGSHEGAPAWIAIESLYSMDGDRAPLTQFVELADRTGAILLIDEAHATGLFGERGIGLGAGLDGRDNVIVLRTCGKAMGCEGALVFLPSTLRDFLVNRARPFIFSTAPSPLMAVAVQEAIKILVDEPVRRQRLAELADYAFAQLEQFGVRRTGSQILPLVIGDDARTMDIAAELQARGFDVRGIRPPTVPAGTSRLRISITLNVDEAAIDALADALKDVLE
jgi:8-amino-7-oxononanoate synthase